uniref:Ovule protein n=1 Tax=Schistosoma curassoni TaxID=6186 RepID=A0A183KC79_9TREM
MCLQFSHLYHRSLVENLVKMQSIQNCSLIHCRELYLLLLVLLFHHVSVQPLDHHLVD